MVIKVSELIKLQPKKSELANRLDKPLLSELFTARTGTYVNDFTLYISYFNNIPNLIEEVRIDCKKALNWFTEAYRADIKDLYFTKRYLRENDKNPEYDDICYILFDDLIVNFDTNCSNVRFLFRNTEFSKIENIISEIKRFKKRSPKRTPLISLLINTGNGVETEPMRISKPKLNIEDNYNDDFKDVHQTIIKRLSKQNDKGLVVLHGKPGTGKTSYIRYLISSVKKGVIFLPPNMARALTDPDLISLLIKNSNSIFVIEDAENIVIDREKDGNSPVSALLNISDGLLSDCLNIQIICSFNTDLSKVDNALLRKGRLIAKYEFKELEVSKAQALSDKLGFASKFNSSRTLTDIYNQEEKEFQQNINRNSIGFRVSESVI